MHRKPKSKPSAYAQLWRKRWLASRPLAIVVLTVLAILSLFWFPRYSLDELDPEEYEHGVVRLPPPPPYSAPHELLDSSELPWWGSVDAVGGSPWDHVPKTRSRGGLRMLFLLDYRDFLERPNSVFYEIVDAARRHPALEVADVWGPGWAGWNNELPISRNLQARVLPQESCNLHDNAGTYAEGHCSRTPHWINAGPLRCGFYDIVWTFSEFRAKEDPLMDNPGCGTVMVHQLGDCHAKLKWIWAEDKDYEIEYDPDQSCVQHFYPYQGNITLSKYSFELLEIFNHDRLKRLYPDMPMQFEWDYYPMDWSLKTEDAVVFGHDGILYPIRTTVTTAIKEGPKSTFIKEHEAPDYVIQHAEEDFTTNVPPTYWPELPHYKPQVQIRDDFANGMRNARICVFDSVVERKLIRKYAQAMLSGCVIAADIPTEHEDVLREFVIELKNSWDIKQINSVLKNALAAPHDLRQKALLGFAYARQHFTNLAKVSRVISLVDRYRAGERGYDLPYGFSLRCRSYWATEEGYKAPWCQGLRGLES